MASASGSFAEGAIRGAGLAMAQQDRERQAGREARHDQRVAASDERAQELHGLQVAGMRQQQDIMAEERAEVARNRATEKLQRATRALGAYFQGRDPNDPVPDQDREMLRGIVDDAFNEVQLDPRFLASDPGAAAAQALDQIVDTGDMSSLNDPMTRRLVGQATFGWLANQGVGKDGRKGKRRLQEVADVTPAPGRPGEVAVAMLVEDDDGAYIAPSTERGEVDDPNVRTFPMDKAMDRAMGYRSLYHALEQENALPYLRVLYASQGGDPAQMQRTEQPDGIATVIDGENIKTFQTRSGVPVGDPIATGPRVPEAQSRVGSGNTVSAAERMKMAQQAALAMYKDQEAKGLMLAGERQTYEQFLQAAMKSINETLDGKPESGGSAPPPGDDEFTLEANRDRRLSRGEIPSFEDAPKRRDSDAGQQQAPLSALEQYLKSGAQNAASDRVEAFIHQSGILGP